MYSDNIKEEILQLIKSNYLDKDLENLFRNSMYPKHRVGAWRYVGLDKVSLEGLTVNNEQNFEAQNVISNICETLGINSSNIIVMHNGKLIHNNLAEGLSITNTSKKKDNCLLNNESLNHWYTVLNQCLTTCTTDIKVDAQYNVKEPLYVIHSSDNDSNKNLITNNQVNIHISNNSEVAITEVFMSSDNSNSIIQNPKSCYHLDSNARCKHTLLHYHNNNTVQFADINVQQASGSEYSCNIITAKGRINRTGINIQLAGERATCNVNSLQWPENNENHDVYLNIDHLCPDTSCDCQSKAIAGEHGCASFTGNITVTSDAHFSEAALTNNNVLLSDTGKIFSRPELEIDNDEVKCSHGTTIGKLDSEMIFYLQSRGISLAEARGILLDSFISPVINNLDGSGISHFVKTFLKDKISNDK